MEMIGMCLGSVDRVSSARALWIAVALTSVIAITPSRVSGQNISDANARFAQFIESYESLAESRGREVYASACAACHGVNGDGKGLVASALDPAPTDFSSAVFKFRSTPTGDLPTDDDIYRSIQLGIPRSTMPSWEGILSEQEMRDVVAYVKTFSDDFRDYGAGEPIEYPAEPSATEIVFAEGKYMYMVLDCWTCHGGSGRGDGESAKGLKDDRGRKSNAFDFTTGHYKGGNDNQSIFRTFETGLDGTPMPSYANTFSFGGDTPMEFDAYGTTYSDAEIQALKDYLASQPTVEELAGMPQDELAFITGRRKWAMVYYMKTLAREPGLLYKLFIHDHEVTQ